METQPDALSEDQVVVITSRTRDRLGLLWHKPANCHSPSPKEVRIEIKCLPPAEAGFISKRSIENKNPRQARQPMCVWRLESGGSRSSQLRSWVFEEPGSRSAAERAWWGLGGCTEITDGFFPEEPEAAVLAASIHPPLSAARVLLFAFGEWSTPVVLESASPT